MCRFNLTPLLLLALALGLGSMSASAADATPAGVLQQVSATTVAHAVTSPMTAEDYQQMQDSAPEVVVIRVTNVKTEVGTPADKSVNTAPLMVTAQAAVIRVIRTATNLKTGSVIYLLYGHVPPSPGQSSFAPIPILNNNAEYTAYLAGGPADKNPYRPAARDQSFVDDAAPANHPGTAKPTGPIADPALLPSPDNPTPTGVPRLTRTNLAQFAKAINTSGHWGVSIANADPLPLQTSGQGAPTLLAYYPASIRAPDTQPKVLVYQTGDATPPTPTMERALIIDNNGRLLGDVLWALRNPVGQTPPPLPIWHWLSYKLEVEDPGTHVAQAILLDGSH